MSTNKLLRCNFPISNLAASAYVSTSCYFVKCGKFCAIFTMLCALIFQPCGAQAFIAYDERYTIAYFPSFKSVRSLSNRLSFLPMGSSALNYLSY